MWQCKWGTSDQTISVLGQGTYDMENGDEATTIASVHRGLELGLTHIDTAEAYGSGACERFLAKALEGKREQAFVVSKVHPKNATYEGTLEACERSLQRLKTDYLDGYLLHWHEGPPMEETFRAFEKLLEDGKIRTWGVSNFEVHELKHAISLVGEGKIVCNQIEYFISQRANEAELMPYCREHDVTIVAHSPFGDKRFPAPDSEGGQLLAQIGEAHGASARATAIAYLLRTRDVCTIPKAGKIPHLEDNARGLEITLTAEQIADIERVFPRS